MECGGAEKAGNRACKAYYTKLKPGKTYKAEVKKDIAVVSASVTSPSGKEGIEGTSVIPLRCTLTLFP